MQIGEAVQGAMNAQIGHEFGAANRYLAMSSWCAGGACPGVLTGCGIRRRKRS